MTDSNAIRENAEYTIQPARTENEARIVLNM